MVVHGDERSTIRIWGIVPAAGLSRRMGRPKQILRFGASTVTGTVVGTLLSADPAGVVVVTRRTLLDGLALPADPRVRCLINDDDASEMIDSIRLALDALAGGEAGHANTAVAHGNLRREGDRADTFSGPVPAAGTDDGICVVPGDLPHLSTATVTACFGAFRRLRDRIIVAVHEGRRAHPMVFPFAYRAEVAALMGGLNDLMRAHPDDVAEIPTEDSGAVRDLDAPGDLTGMSNGE